MSWTYKPFENFEHGVVREPVNVEQISVKVDTTRIWLSVRKNEQEIKFDLPAEQAKHLAKLLREGAEQLSQKYTIIHD